MSTNVRLNISLFLLGLLGVVSLLLSPLPGQIPEEALEKFSPGVLKLLILINPTVLLLFAVLLGGSLAPKVGLDAPVLRAWLAGKKVNLQFFEQLKVGVPTGLIAGIAISVFYFFCEPYIPDELLELSKNMDIKPLTKFLYGGITEEILVRWGVMSLFVWLGWKVFGDDVTLPSQGILWTGILLSAFLFGLGHLPVVFATVSEVSAFLIFYIIVGNMLMGVLAGWLFWKKGLEAAMIAHIFGHVSMIIIAAVVG